VPFLRGPKSVPPGMLRELHPMRNPSATWTRNDDAALVTIEMPRPITQGWRKALAKFVGEPPGRRIELSDAIASDVWEMCDGDTSVGDICKTIATRYKLGDRQTQVSVLQFLNMLRSRSLVGIPPGEQAAIDAQIDVKKASASALPRSEDGNGSNGRNQQSAGRARRSRRH
jgi:hypothetical protein